MDMTTDNGECEWIPKLGMAFEGEQEAYDFYNFYGRRCGFSIRKDKFGKNRKTGEITSRVLVCSKQGVRSTTRRDQLPKNPRAETRCNCMAHMGVQLNRKNNKFEVYTFKKEHNHDLVPTECSHQLESQRRISELQDTHIDLAEQSRIPLGSTHEFLQLGVRQSVDFTNLDQKNYLRSKRQKNLGYGEAGSIHEYFNRRTIDNPSFFYSIQFDGDELITNIFWADARMRIDYGLFGDVLSFDTTYRINKEHRPFVLFVGLNHHRETVVFGAALIYDETVESFKWLFRTFLEAMSNRQPRTMFTDQDAVMEIAVAEVFPTTFHRLCMCHIMQNALKHTSNLATNDSNLKVENSKDETITSQIAHFMNHIDEEAEFLDAWDSMLHKHNVRENRWLKMLFDARKKWAHCYVCYSWDADMKSTQLSESFNSCLKKYLKSDHDIIQFFMHFDRVLADKRHNELVAEYSLCHRLPKVKINVRIVIHAREIYTKIPFEEFQEEVMRSLELSTIARGENDDGNSVYKMGSQLGGSKVWYVTRKVDNDFLSCSCRSFETKGIICRHIIKILREEFNNSIQIPPQYIMNRWTRKARSTTMHEFINVDNIQPDVRLKEAERSMNLCAMYTKIAYRAGECDEAYAHAVRIGTQLHAEIEDIIRRRLDRVSLDDGDDDSQSVQVEETIDEDATNIQEKGLKKRQDPFRRGALEQNLSKRKGKKPSSQAKRVVESSVYTPIPPNTSHSTQISQASQTSSCMPLMDGGVPSYMPFYAPQSDVSAFRPPLAP